EAEVLEQLLVWIRACGLSIEADVHACLDSEVRAVWLLEDIGSFGGMATWHRPAGAASELQLEDD
ncbi:hypothetical protein HaLaN_29054, partial [Haematococcus lacustris]